MSDYTPTTDEIEFAYVDRQDFVAAVAFSGRLTDDEYKAQFRRWLAQHDAEVADEIERYYREDMKRWRRFLRTVRDITRNGESLQTPKSAGGSGDECTISPPDLREALRALRRGDI